MKHLFISVLVVLTLLAQADIASAQKKKTSSKTVGLDAPTIMLRSNGSYNITDCPTTYPGLDVRLKMDDVTVQEITVYRNGSKMQSFSLDENDDDIRIEGDTEAVHFLDANFDGYVDFFVGPVHSRTYSVLYLWSNAKKKFVRASVKEFGFTTNSFNGDFEFFPGSKLVYSAGSSSAYESFVFKHVWNGTKLTSSEELVMVFLPERYGENNVSKRYTVRNSKTHKVICSTNDINRLPAEWRKRAFNPDE